MQTRRSPGIPAMAALLVALTGCSSEPFPEGIDFGAQKLTRAGAWTREGISGVVYVPPGETLPAASLQVGVIISSEHATANDLHVWVIGQFNRSSQGYYESGTSGESCKVGVSHADGGRRTFMSLQVCKTGVARAACVEADEALDEGVFTTCFSNPACFEDVCDQRWLDQREALDVLVADFLTKR